MKRCRGQKPTGRRNPVASASHVNRAQTHVDRKRAMKAGKVKHKRGYKDALQEL
jgi:hypothetical protein